MLMGSGGTYLLPIKLLILHVISDSLLGCSGDGKGNGAQFDGGQDQRGAYRHAGYGLARGNALAHPNKNFLGSAAGARWCGGDATSGGALSHVTMLISQASPAARQSKRTSPFRPRIMPSMA